MQSSEQQKTFPCAFPSQVISPEMEDLPFCCCSVTCDCVDLKDDAWFGLGDQGFNPLSTKGGAQAVLGPLPSPAASYP